MTAFRFIFVDNKFIFRKFYPFWKVPCRDLQDFFFKIPYQLFWMDPFQRPDNIMPFCIHIPFYFQHAYAFSDCIQHVKHGSVKPFQCGKLFTHKLGY